MALEMMALGEALAARRALMSLLAGVRQHVPGQHVTVCKCLSACLKGISNVRASRYNLDSKYLADIGSFTGVTSLVLDPTAEVGELPLAVSTTVGLLARVSSTKAIRWLSIRIF